MKILVTGGAGFLGSHLVDQLINLNHEVMIVDNFSSGKVDSIHVRAGIACCDTRDKKIEAVFERFRPDLVYHFASRTRFSESLFRLKNTSRYDVDDDLSGTLNVLNACLRSGVKKIVFASSIEVYGDVTTHSVNEDHPLNPKSYHGKAKLKQEQYVESYYENYGLSYTILRFSSVYGRRQEYSGESHVFSSINHCIQNDIPLMLKPRNNKIRDCLYIDDAIKACEATLSSNTNGVFNIGLGIPIGANEFVSKIEDVLEKKALYLPTSKHEQRSHHNHFDISKSTRTLAWEPMYSLYRGLEEMMRPKESKFELTSD